jgi:ferrous iron transport protein B
VFGGVGTVVSFVPIIIILFFFLSILEDSGYMARVAFVTDKLLRKLGLSGRSIVPLLIGFGCSVPAVMATRTLPSSRDRKMTILLTPFVSCSAKIPIYAFFTNAFFPGHGGLVLVILYLSAILIGILVALVCKYLPKQLHPTPFVMELPNYRMPGAKNVGHLLWDKTKDFLQRAFTVIFIASIVIWVLQSFDWRLRLVDPEDSMLASVAGLIAPLFRPLGLGDWRIVTALVTGFLAKESVVATLEVLNVTASMTALTAIPMLAFCLLYTPCVAAIAAVRRELGGKWALGVVVFQCCVAWVVAWLAYLIAGPLF